MMAAILTPILTSKKSKRNSNSFQSTRSIAFFKLKWAIPFSIINQLIKTSGAITGRLIFIKDYVPEIERVACDEEVKRVFYYLDRGTGKYLKLQAAKPCYCTYLSLTHRGKVKDYANFDVPTNKQHWGKINYW